MTFPDRNPDETPEVMAQLREFVREREWAQFHTPENLAKSIAIEAGELLECFQWSAEADAGEVGGELADVLTYAYLLADRLGLDPEKAQPGYLDDLDALYGYMIERLTEANRNNDPDLIDEVARLLITVKSGWDAIASAQ